MDAALTNRGTPHSTVVSGGRVRFTGEAARVLPPSQQAACEPRIDLVRDGDLIRAIDIRCACGKRIYLECDY